MNAQQTMNLKLFSLVRPTKDGEDHLIYNPCDGWRVVEWDDADQVFRMFMGDPLDANYAVFWTELPSTYSMCAMAQAIACQEVRFDSLIESEKPLILTEQAQVV